MPESEIVAELRRLIVRAAPDPSQARPVESCGVDQPLDSVIPFSSLIILGTVVAIEDRFEIRVSHADLREAAMEGITLVGLAQLIEARIGAARSRSDGG